MKNRKNKGVNKTEPDIIIHKHPKLIEWVSGVVLDLSNRQFIFWLSATLFLVSIIAYYPTFGEDYDVWFHLKYGEHFVKNLTWTIDHSQFSWTGSIPDWTYVTWIASSVLYIAYKIGDITLLYGVLWMILIAIGCAYFYYARLLNKKITVNHIVLLFLALIVINLTAGFIKPEMFSTMFFSGIVFIYFYTKSTRKSCLIYYPVIFLIWVNTHGGFILGLVFISLALAGEIFNYLFKSKDSFEKEFIVKFGGYVFLSYLATLINPYGIYYQYDTFNNLFSKEYMGTASALFAYFSLWDYLWPENLMLRYVISAWAIMILAVTYLGSVLLLVKKRKLFDISLFLLTLSFFYLGMKIARASMFFPLIAIYAITYAGSKFSSEKIENCLKPVSVLMTVVLSISICFFALRYYDHRSWMGWNMDELIPVNEVTFIKKNKIQGPLFNDYLIGSYMLWSMYPEYKVWIDTRYGPYVKTTWPDWLGLRQNLTPDGFKKYYSKYLYKAALIHMRERYIIAWFLSSPEWRLVYFDKVAVVFMHKSLIPTLSPNALSTDVNPSRFQKISNPETLTRLFNFYLLLGTSPDIRTSYASQMILIYDQNVSKYFINKEQHIKTMRQAIEQVNASLRQTPAPR